jgi:hypothetical protein
MLYISSLRCSPLSRISVLLIDSFCPYFNPVDCHPVQLQTVPVQLQYTYTGCCTTTTSAEWHHTTNQASSQRRLREVPPLTLRSQWTPLDRCLPHQHQARQLRVLSLVLSLSAYVNAREADHAQTHQESEPSRPWFCRQNNYQQADLNKLVTYRNPQLPKPPLKRRDRVSRRMAGRLQVEVIHGVDVIRMTGCSMASLSEILREEL